MYTRKISLLCVAVIFPVLNGHGENSEVAGIEWRNYELFHAQYVNFLFI